MADLLALLQSKAESLEEVERRKQQEVKEKEEQEEARLRSLAEMRSGLVEKKRAYAEKQKLLEDKKRERHSALRNGGISISVSLSAGDLPSCRDVGLELDESTSDSEDTVSDDTLSENTPDMDKKWRRRSTIRTEDVEYEKGDAGSVTVGAATLPALINLLVTPAPPVAGFDVNHFLEVFLLTHSVFIQSTLLFDILVKVFSNEYKHIELDATTTPYTRVKVLQILLKWVKNYPRDFMEESILRLLVDKWIVKMKATLTVTATQTEVKEREQEAIALLDQLQKALVTADQERKAKIEALAREEAERKQKEADRKEEERKMNIDSSKDNMHEGMLLKYSPAMLAQQMTLVDFKLFSKIEFQEFFNCGWTRENKMELSPNLVRFIERFNQLSSWIQTQIVSAETVESRAELLSRVIQIGKEFEAMNNFQGMMLINAALNSSPISRLKNSWALVSEGDMSSFNGLMAFLSHHKNYQVYRNRLHTCEPPLIPFAAIYLTDLTFIAENEDKRPRHKSDEAPSLGEGGGDGPEGEKSAEKVANGDEEDMLINFYKMELLSKVLMQVRQFQKVGYDRYQPSVHLQKFLGGVEAEEHEKLKYLTEKEIYENSLRVEPKSSHTGKPQGSRKRGFSLGRNHKSPRGAASPNQIRPEDEEKHKKKTKKPKAPKYGTMQGAKKSGSKRGSSVPELDDLVTRTNPLLDKNLLARRMSEPDLTPSVDGTPSSPGSMRNPPLSPRGTPSSPRRRGSSSCIEPETKVLNPLHMSKSLASLPMYSSITSLNLPNPGDHKSDGKHN